MDSETSFGRHLKQRRKAQDLSREELAHCVGCSVETIRKLETDARRPSRQIAELLAHHLDVPTAERQVFLRAARTPRSLPAADHADVPVVRRYTSTVPSPSTPLIGRAQEVAEICSMLTGASIRLLTLIGPPGIGKTRLAMQVAADLRDIFADGVLFVRLAPISDSALVAAAIAQAAGVREVPGQPLAESVKAYLHVREAMLLLDNVEHVVEAVPLVGELLLACPRLKVLATSRSALQLSGEHRYMVPPLAVPLLGAEGGALPDVEQVAEYAAVRLFVARARAVNHAFALTDANVRDIAELCTRLDGLPLAIELATARLNVLSPQTLLAHITGVSGRRRLDLLAGSVRDHPVRQQTLRGAISWSVDLLDSIEKRLFAWLSVFAGGCTWEAVEYVVGDQWREVRDQPIIDQRPPTTVLDALASLLDKSLVQRVQPPAGIVQGELRYSMLELIREYALEQLDARGEAGDARWQHATYYLDLVERAEPELSRAEQAAWLRRLVDEYDNIRAGLEWLVAHRAVELAARMGAALWQFWEVRGMLSEGRGWLEQILEGGRSLSSGVRADVLNAAGQLARHQGDVTRAATLFDENLQLRRQRGQPQGIAYALNDLGLVRVLQGDIATGVAYLEESLALFRVQGDKGGVADVLPSLSGARLMQGNRPEAAALATESLALFRELGNLRGIAATLSVLAFLHLSEGDEGQAVPLFEESLRLAQQVADQHFAFYGLVGLGAVAAQRGQAARAAILLGGAEALRDALGVPPLPAFMFDLDAALAMARAQLDAATWQTAWREGQRMRLEQAIADALEGVEESTGGSQAVR